MGTALKILEQYGMFKLRSVLLRRFFVNSRKKVIDWFRAGERL